ncbi:Pros54 [Cordylochernes scorpioides]|uniref:Pros54 n=1 Tax=Cordylochernes scorpioides TaxID=51811 RepID=A0ABY6KLB0_9ARAC|nr:Pros54 [Cordylochernes scorpioides]
MRIVVFVGSPLEVDDKEIIKFAKKLKKEKVNVDIINFGEDTANTDKLTTFINTINGKDGTGSHLVTVPPGPHLSDALISSPIVQGEDGGGAPGGAGTFEFGVDPNEDPELALALRVSMEEQRQRQEEQARRAAEAVSVPETVPETAGTNEEELLERALAMSMETDQAGHPTGGSAVPDFASMTEDEQIAYAMQMSLQQAQSQETPMDTDQREEDYSEVMNDPEFLQSVLENLPGIIKFAKKLKKEKVNVDIINFGEDQTANTDKLTTFINTINGKDGTGSPIVQGEDGGGAPGGAGTFEFGVDPNEDPELALALRVSMEEQRQRQEEQARRAAEAVSVPETVPESTNEEELLERALAMSMETDQAGHPTGGSAVPDFASMTEDEQIAYAMQMSLQQAQSQETPMDTDQREEDYSEVMNDPEFLQSVLENLPGVDPQSDAIRSAMGTLNPERKSEEDKKKKEEKK